MKALALAMVILSSCGGEAPYEAPKAFDQEVCRLHCTTLCTHMVECFLDSGEIAPYAVDKSLADCYGGCEVGLTEVIYDGKLDDQGLFDYCDTQRQKPQPNCSVYTERQ